MTHIIFLSMLLAASQALALSPRVPTIPCGNDNHHDCGRFTSYSCMPAAPTCTLIQECDGFCLPTPPIYPQCNFDKACPGGYTCVPDPRVPGNNICVDAKEDTCGTQGTPSCGPWKFCYKDVHGPESCDPEVANCRGLCLYPFPLAFTP